jgi:hypothetical protein
VPGNLVAASGATTQRLAIAARSAIKNTGIKALSVDGIANTEANVRLLTTTWGTPYPLSHFIYLNENIYNAGSFPESCFRNFVFTGSNGWYLESALVSEGFVSCQILPGSPCSPSGGCGYVPFQGCREPAPGDPDWCSVPIPPPTILPPGTSMSISGKTSAADPTLAGTTSFTGSANFNCGSGRTGYVYYSTLKSALLGTLDFYYRVQNDATSVASITKVTLKDFSNAIDLEANYRPDGVGTKAPNLVSRSSGTGDTLDFAYSSAIAPGQESKSIYARSGRTAHDSGGSITITYAGGATCTVPNTFRPIP